MKKRGRERREKVFGHAIRLRDRDGRDLGEFRAVTAGQSSGSALGERGFSAEPYDLTVRWAKGEGGPGRPVQGWKLWDSDTELWYTVEEDLTSAADGDYKCGCGRYGG